jgi:class 3 adenylate cyclase
MSSGPDRITTFIPPPQREEIAAKSLVVVGGHEDGERFVFYERIEIGRLKSNNQVPGRLLLEDGTVSSRHCILTQDPDGRCFIRDVSRNGTRVEGRRLSPNLRTEIQMGQVITIGRGHQLRLEGETPTATQPSLLDDEPSTHALSTVAMVTVLVGDISDYTTMVQDAAPHHVEQSVSRVFQRLERAVLDLGGTVKEFQGDAIFAFWEEDHCPEHAREACRAALRLHHLAGTMAADPTIWDVAGFPLEMDWALATGPVAMHGHGGEHAVGLAMVGEPVVLAFRIEKFAAADTGRIIACPRTHDMAGDGFMFQPLGSHQVKGLDREFALYSLTGETTPL